MMSYYFVKQDLPGLPKGSVERFSLMRAGAWKSEGAIEDFDPKRHAKAPGAADAIAFLAGVESHLAEMAEAKKA